MPYFQNVFDIEWRGDWVVADSNYRPHFKLGPNRNSSDNMRSWVVEPYNLSSNAVLTINYAFDLDLKNYASRAINVQGATPASTTAIEVCNKLNADTVFSELWIAQPVNFYKGGVGGQPAGQAGAPGPYCVYIKSIKRPKQSMRTYISNTGAELSLGFNLKAPVGPLPAYFERHTVANRFNYPDSMGNLIYLDPDVAADQQIITAAGYDYEDVADDYTYLYGAAPAFPVEKNTYTDSKLTQSIKYNAGARVGDAATKTIYTYDGSNVATKMTIPYVLTADDLVTPA